MRLWKGWSYWRPVGVVVGVGVSHPLTCFATHVAGFVVGHAGLLQALAMLLVAYFILALTVLSVCAIATNGAVRGGGAYCILQCCWIGVWALPSCREEEGVPPPSLGGQGKEQQVLMGVLEAADMGKVNNMALH